MVEVILEQQFYYLVHEAEGPVGLLQVLLEFGLNLYDRSLDILQIGLFVYVFFIQFRSIQLELVEYLHKCLEQSVLTLEQVDQVLKSCLLV